ncbi:PfkB domain protein [Halorubrum aidingense JCM 13560]|uniref:PfkB domain protein n=1 Tax=Halorubrum aidingense JCM 13560 TaxID=1230454 RepID=M0PD43_9EURY|nr:carbohydrate kinase [Halorubrum aidingense]EMA67798.1 PfkB domain protein [Halorubrum aidingense JCM 13560]
MPEILVAGETLVDFLPGEGATLRDVEGFSHRPGGAPANVAVGLARLGVVPAFWTRLGGDPFGDFLAETLGSELIPTTQIERVDGNTTLAVVSLPETDDRRFRFYGAGDVTFGFDPDAVPTDALASASWVHLGGVALTHPRGREAMVELATRAADHGCTVSFDVNYRPDLVAEGATDDVLAALREVVEASDVVFCSEEEVAETGLSSRWGAGLARDLCALGPHTAVVTLGADGALAASTADAPWGEATVRHEGFAVESRDTTGAGDAFTAGLIARLAAGSGSDADGPSDEESNERGASDGAALDDALAFANATAALSVRDIGGMSALPTREAVAAFLDDDDA